MITGLCAKIVVTATIVCPDGRRFIGMNWCCSPQLECPREEGEGYLKCTTICGQYGHAEDLALGAAGGRARGGVLYLQGHSYSCDNCRDLCRALGIEKIVIGPPPLPAPCSSKKSTEGEQYV